jgi:hypothetical protein
MQALSIAVHFLNSEHYTEDTHANKYRLLINYLLRIAHLIGKAASNDPVP